MFYEVVDIASNLLLGLKKPVAPEFTFYEISRRVGISVSIFRHSDTMEKNAGTDSFSANLKKKRKNCKVAAVRAFKIPLIDSPIDALFWDDHNLEKSFTGLAL